MLALFVFAERNTLLLNRELSHVHVVTYTGDMLVSTSLVQSGIISSAFSGDLAKVISKYKRIKSVSAIVCVDVVPSQMRSLSIMSCNEVARFAARCDIGFTLTPCHLHRKLLRLDKKRNYTILMQWRRADGNG